jgi:hypothetical protein
MKGTPDDFYTYQSNIKELDELFCKIESHQDRMIFLGGMVNSLAAYIVAMDMENEEDFVEKTILLFKEFYKRNVERMRKYDGT